MATKDDGMEGGADPCGAPGGGPDVKTGTYDGDRDGGTDYGGAPGMNPPFPMPADTSTNNEPELTC